MPVKAVSDLTTGTAVVGLIFFSIALIGSIIACIRARGMKI